MGVGDGPWEMMKEFDDGLPTRRFDNFQFVEYNAVMKMNAKNPDAGFAIMALMELPGALLLNKCCECTRSDCESLADQYKTIRRLGMLG